MLLLTICDDSYSDTLNEGLCDFVSSNTAEIVQMEIDLVEDSDCNLEFIFPRAFLKSHRREECCEVLRAIRDRLSSLVDKIRSSITATVSAILPMCEL